MPQNGGGPASIAVVGSYGVGLTFEVDRVPQAGETVTGEHFRADPGGKGSNQAIGAARLGARVSLLTAVGNDQFGDEARRIWAAEGVDAGAVVRIPLATMAGVILVENGGENRIVIVPGALSALTPQHVEAFAPQIAAADACLVQLEIPLETARHALVTARREGVRTILNPAPAPARPLPEDLLGLADHLTPNYSEACRLVGVTAGAEELAELLREAGARSVAITLGGEGALLSTARGSERVPSLAAGRVLDTTGAGDAFNAAFAVALAEGRSELEAVSRGCAAGAYAVSKPGVLPGLPTRAELESRLASTAGERAKAR